MVNFSSRMFAIFCLLGCAAVVSPAFASEKGECQTLTATGNSEYPPYLFRTDYQKNELNGAIRLIMDEIGKRLNRPIQLRHVGSWSRAQEEVKSGRVDLIAGAFYTVPRNQWMDYVYPAFLDTTSSVWVQINSPTKFESRDDLVGLRGVTVINNSFGQEFDQFAKNNLKIEYVASLKQVFKMLSLGRVDYGLYEKNPGLAYATKLEVADKVQFLEPAISSEGLYLTISHKSVCNTGKLRGELSKVVRELIAEGFHSQALSQGLEHWNRSQGK